MPRYRVRVTNDELVFCAGHFITFAGNQCERIHGHNWRVAVEIEGDLDVNEYVFDFIALRDQTAGIVRELDHRMLLPGTSRLIRLEDSGPNWLVRFEERYWSFPKDECVVLPVANTTTERIAEYLCDRLRRGWSNSGVSDPALVCVELEESFGQSARVEWIRGE
jgi:6-pyruvoyltetrahydropterin/6-carboxytetrahydropterin synthase